jgi:hypothetical protein
LFADFAPARIDGGIVDIAGQAVQQIARADLVEQIRRIVAVEWVLHRIEVIEVAPKFVEAVHGRQVLVAIAEMIFAKLPGGVTHRLQGRRDGRRLRRHADRGAGLPNCREAGANRQLTGDEIRAAGGAACFRIIIGEAHALVGHLVQMRRAPGHDALIVDADIRPADIIAHNDNNVRLLTGLRLCGFPVDQRRQCRCGSERSAREQDIAAIDGVCFGRISVALIRHLLFLPGQRAQHGCRRHCTDSDVTHTTAPVLRFDDSSSMVTKPLT